MLIWCGLLLGRVDGWDFNTLGPQNGAADRCVCLMGFWPCLAHASDVALVETGSMEDAAGMFRYLSFGVVYPYRGRPKVFALDPARQTSLSAYRTREGFWLVRMSGFSTVHCETSGVSLY